MSFFQYQYRTEKFYFSWPVFMRCLFCVGSGPKSEFRVLNRFTQETPLAWSLCAHFLVWSSKIRKSNENCGTCLTDETVALRIFGSTFRQKSAPMSYVSHWTLEHCYNSPYWSSVISCIAVSSKSFWNSISSYLLQQLYVPLFEKQEQLSSGRKAESSGWDLTTFFWWGNLSSSDVIWRS